MRAFNKREKEMIKELVLLKDKYGGSIRQFVREYIFPLSNGGAM